MIGIVWQRDQAKSIGCGDRIILDGMLTLKRRQAPKFSAKLNETPEQVGELWEVEVDLAGGVR